jgi:hypothetical protein
MGPVCLFVLPAQWTVMSVVMERNFMNNIWIFDTRRSLMLSVCVSTYCKMCLILEKQLFIFSFCCVLDP